jgi:MFS family permease
MDATQFVYLAEIFPMHIRGQGMALGMAAFSIATIILLCAGPPALDRIGWKFFFVLIFPTALHLLGVYFLYPETKQRSLEDINAAFGEKVAVRYYGATEEDEAMYAKAIQGGQATPGDEEKSAASVGSDAHVEEVSKV